MHSLTNDLVQTMINEKEVHISSSIYISIYLLLHLTPHQLHQIQNYQTSSIYKQRSSFPPQPDRNQRRKRRLKSPSPRTETPGSAGKRNSRGASRVPRLPRECRCAFPPRVRISYARGRGRNRRRARETAAARAWSIYAGGAELRTSARAPAARLFPNALALS